MDVQEKKSLYPPAPWQCQGNLWMGAFLTQNASPLPPGFQSIFSPRIKIVAIIRYLEGPFRYDECIIGSLVRRKLRPGILIEQIWVNHAGSLQAGREIWGLPKQMAHFSWQENHVQVFDQQEELISISFHKGTRILPQLPLVCPGFGNLKNQWTWVISKFQASLNTAQMEILSFHSHRFGYHLSGKARLAMMTPTFHATISPPKIILN